MPGPNKSVREKRLVSSLRAFRRDEMGEWASWRSTPRPLSIAKANEYLLGVMLDQGGRGWRQWEAAKSVAAAFGNKKTPTRVWHRMAAASQGDLEHVLRYGHGGKAAHHYWKRFSGFFSHAAQHLVKEYGGDPRGIWRGQDDVDEVKRRLMQVRSIGLKKANMGVLILARDHGLLGGRKAARALDVAVDVQVRRVFSRVGFVALTASNGEIIDKARQLAPDWPAVLDAPAWEIGARWCGKRCSRSRHCSQCPLDKQCPKVGTTA